MIGLKAPQQAVQATIQIGGSKSISNRLLILKKTLGLSTQLYNLSDSEDTGVILRALEIVATSNNAVIDVMHAGTGMRFLTALLASVEGNWTLTGSAELCKRPVKDLVDALMDAGVSIRYLNREGYPPLQIKGRKLVEENFKLNASVSSQFATALILIAPSLQKGCSLQLNGKISSASYLNMTVELLRFFGVECTLKDNYLRIEPFINKQTPSVFSIESDWSSASYWYSICALSPKSQIKLSTYSKKSWQGDSVLPEIYELLGVSSEFDDSSLILTNTGHALKSFEYNFSNCPDIAQTLAVTCFGLGIGASLKGLHTLPVKETNRIKALKTELEKFGLKVNITNDSLEFTPNATIKAINTPVIINTYKDHRMAMSFAPLSLVYNNLFIDDESVTSKSYPGFWNDLKSAGFSVNLQP